MGLTETKLQKELGSVSNESVDTQNEKYFGLQNFGNTCYANSILQVLFYCKPLRQYLLDLYKQLDLQNLKEWEEEPGILFALCDLFQQMSALEGTTTFNKKRGSSLAPKQFILKLRREASIFNTLMHQDAQEFWSYLINSCVETLQKQQSLLQKRLKTTSEENITEKMIATMTAGTSEIDVQLKRTFFHTLFEGEIRTETRCITCETSSERMEKFLELSLDVVQNTSLSHCLQRFFSAETLQGNNKFYCDNCCSLQEAQKRSTITKWPRVLCLHLKRFKFDEQLGQHRKLTYRIAFPMELRTQNTDQTMSLFAVVVHVGSGPNSGHYKSVIKSDDKWIMFDDDLVSKTDETFVRSLYGCPGEHISINETGYMLFYAMDNPS
jgi:ubiquitin carboxyl-terminal hydrolase 12/46